MGRVLVNQDQPVGAFGDQVAGSGLADRAQDRGRRVTVRLHRCRGPRSVVQRELRAGDGHGGWALRRAVAKRVAAVQRGTHRSLQSREDRAFIAKSDLLLRRMDVHVDKLGIDADVDDGDWMAAALEPSLIALLEGVDKRPCADRPPVDREHHAVAAAPTEARLAHQAGDQRHADHLQHLSGDRGTVNSGDRAPPVAVAVAAHRRTAVDREMEADVRVEQRERADHVLDGRDLGRVALEKLESRRQVGEQVANLDRDSRQERPHPLLDDLAVADPKRRATAGAFHVRHGGNARQRFAAKTKGFDDREVGQRRQLAGRMADEREAHLVRGDADAVIADADRDLAGATDVDADPPGASVEGVFDQLLHHRCRALDHLARGDRVSDLGREHLDHEVNFARS